MEKSEVGKVIIVEGKTDAERIRPLFAEPVRIVPTGGTLSYSQEEAFADSFSEDEVYILVDADAAGMKLRRQLIQAVPHARHLYTRRMYREVATTPVAVLVDVFLRAHFELCPEWLELSD